ncbi:hypothetical protein H2508_06170 [Parahaliea sp. F7430]|uniref:Uncharacterized protein n=1 Tax=Sediminihaliea albiluteola TaxID=2758564 RepID=A0A7W2TVF9_9GAMM|nr:hypothetical protein [Sediminihaliea albiluteola]MBA6412696.1 hypothetical protein [Sediminihaliea albiluteola]
MTRDACLAAIEALHPPSEIPSPQQYLRLYHPSHSSYSTLPSVLLKAETQLSQADPRLVEAYNRFLLAYLLSEFHPSRCPLILTESIKELFDAQIKRLNNSCEQGSTDHFTLHNDSFRKDLAIATGRLIPLGAEFAQVNAGIPRRLLISGGAKQFCRFGAFMIRQKGQLSGFLELHAHPHYLDDFNPEGWTLCLKRLAKLLQHNPNLPGVFSSSWFLDPQLERISPRLAYLREQTIASGAQLFYVGPDTTGNSGAINRSPTRRILFERGEYTPVIYTRIWTRPALCRSVACLKEY